MAEEDQHKPAAEVPSTAGEVVVAAEEKTVAAKEDLPPPAAVEAEPEKPSSPIVEAQKISQSVSFKEESNVAGELPEPQKKALEELKALIQEALNKHEFTAPPPPPPVKEEEKAEAAPVVAAATEEAVTEEPKKEEVVAVEESSTTEEPKKPEVAVTEEAEPPKAEVAEPEPAVVAVVEKLTVVDDDGAKTVEAIEETIVSVSTVAAEPEEPKEAEPEVKEAEAEVTPPEPVEPEEVFIWGIPLLGDDKSDAILLKFLRARDFKVKEAFTMIKSTVLWRKEFGIEAILEEDLGNELGKVVFMQGADKEGHPVCYNVYGEFQNKELYQSAFSDEEKRTKFLKWRIQFLEKSIRNLDFSPTGINTIVQVNDLKNSPGPAKRELRQATNQALTLLQDNYPEFVAKQVFINVPWWYLAFNRMISPFLTQRTKSKFVFAGPSKTAETLFRYIAPEQVPVQYGGLSREGEQEFTPADPVTEVTIKPATKHTVEFPVSETGLLVWEVRVIGWDVSYGAEFVPSAEDGYTVIVQKVRKIAPTDEAVISNSFKVGEAGKVVLTFDNRSSKKKLLLYRSKSKVCSE